MTRSGRRAWAFVSLVLVAMAAVGVSRRFSAGRRSLADHPPRELVPSAVAVVPGIDLLGGLFPSAAYVIVTSDGLILIDSGLEPDAGPLKAEMARLGLNWREIRAILLTHAHGDHTGGAEALRRETGARVYAGAGDAAVLRAGGPREAFFSTFHMPGHDPLPTTIDVELRGGETIRVGDVRVRAIAAPGHTPGSICYLAEYRGLRALFAGDVIMMLRGQEPPRTELDKPLGTYSAYLPPCYRGDARDSLATLRELRGLPVPDLVLPGHPRADPSPQSPRLSPARWEEMLVRGIRDMQILLGRYQADGADFLDGQPRTLLPDLVYLGDWHGSAVYGIFAGSRFVLVDAPGGPGLIDFVHAGLRRLGRPPASPSAVLLTACGPEETSGLKDLIRACHPEVVAAASAIPRVRDACPAGTVFLTPEELADRGWFPVVTVPMEGRGWGPVAYRFTLAGKTVLFSGRIPVKLSRAAGERLIADLARPPGDVKGYLGSLDRLEHAGRPDLWLPAAPTHGQNANLYDQEWSREIEGNRLLVRSLTPGASGG